MVGQLDMHMQKNETEPFLTPHTKINSKSITDLMLRAKTTQLLEENTGTNVCHLGLFKTFLDMTPKTLSTKGKENKLDLIKTFYL